MEPPTPTGDNLHRRHGVLRMMGHVLLIVDVDHDDGLRKLRERGRLWRTLTTTTLRLQEAASRGDVLQVSVNVGSIFGEVRSTPSRLILVCLLLFLLLLLLFWFLLLFTLFLVLVFLALQNHFHQI